jgi:hypothetical protein
MPRERLITLSRAQDLAFRLSQTENVFVSGGSGSGKTVLANAIALWAVRTGASCLLVGPDRCLDQPISFRTPDGCHSILLKRAQQKESGNRSATVLAGPLEARARVSRSGLRSAQAILRRAKELLHAHALTPAEVEQSVLFGRLLSAEAADLVAVACQDAARAADALWSGNKRAGRSIGDVLAVVSKARTEVPPDEAAAALISADDGEFDEQLISLAARPDRSIEELALAAAIAALRNPAPSDKTLIEIFRHYGWMSKAFREATELLQQYGSLQAAIANGQNAPGARVIAAFVRNRGEQTASETIRTFEAAQLRYEEDAAALEQYLPRYGLRTFESVSWSSESASASAGRVPPAEFAQRIREGRYASRRLPDLLARLHAVLPQPFVDEMTRVPIEEAPARMCEVRVSDPRTLAAMELRELRSLFAATGFGDLLSLPPLPEVPVSARPQIAPSPRYSPAFLDLLLEIDAESDCFENCERVSWPEGLVRARTTEELAGLAETGKTFDVVVMDDADWLAPNLLERLTRSRLHRLGSAAMAGAISLEQGSRRSRPISVRLEPVDAVGLVHIEAPALEDNELQPAAARLAAYLQRAGYDTALAPHESFDLPRLLVASVDTAEEKRVGRLLDFAHDGVVVLCRSWRPDGDLEAPLSEDARAALFMGWRVHKTFADGVLLEKDGRVAALVNEPESALPTSELIVDLVRRMQSRGWSPVVCWRDAPRDPAELGRLLEARAAARDQQTAVVNCVRGFDPSPPPPVPDPPDDDGIEKLPEVGSIAPATSEPSADLPEPRAVSDDSAHLVDKIDPAPEAGVCERIEEAPAAADGPSPVAVQKTGLLAVDPAELDRPDEPMEVTQAPSGNSPSEVPWPANTQEERPAAVAEEDSAGRVPEADAPQRVEVAAVEQSAWSEASPVVEESLEAPPPPDEAANKESEAVDEHREAEQPDPAGTQIRHFLRHPLELPSDIGPDDDRILRVANDILLAHLKLPDSIRFLSDVTFGPETDAQLADTVRRAIRHEKVRARMSARPYAEAFERVSTSYPVLLLWTMATAVTEQYATSNEKDVWQHAFRAIGLEDAEVGPFTSETVSSKISAIARLYRFDCNTQDGYRHCMKLFMCGGVPKSQMGILVEAFRSAERCVGGSEKPLEDWIREAINAIPIGYMRLRRILRHSDAVAYADAYKRLRNDQSATSAVESSCLRR